MADFLSKFEDDVDNLKDAGCCVIDEIEDKIFNF